jgi:hypothetical protein
MKKVMLSLVLMLSVGTAKPYAWIQSILGSPAKMVALAVQSTNGRIDQALQNDVQRGLFARFFTAFSNR